MKSWGILTAKPYLVVANIGEDDIVEPTDRYVQLEQWGKERGRKVIPICTKFELEASELTEEERGEFLSSVGIERSGVDVLIRACYEILDLITFYTPVGRELKAWTIRKGGTLHDAAGLIHTDIQEGFIRADVVSLPDFLCTGACTARGGVVLTEDGSLCCATGRGRHPLPVSEERDESLEGRNAPSRTQGPLTSDPVPLPVHRFGREVVRGIVPHVLHPDPAEGIPLRRVENLSSFIHGNHSAWGGGQIERLASTCIGAYLHHSGIWIIPHGDAFFTPPGDHLPVTVRDGLIPAGFQGILAGPEFDRVQENRVCDQCRTIYRGHRKDEEQCFIRPPILLPVELIQLVGERESAGAPGCDNGNKG